MLYFFHCFLQMLVIIIEWSEKDVCQCDDTGELDHWRLTYVLMRVKTWILLKHLCVQVLLCFGSSVKISWPTF